MVKVCIIGLGYVGLPLACLASQAHEVFGVDIDEERVRKINSRECPTDEPYTKDIFHKTNLRASTDFFAVSESEVVLICVPTPITDQKIPNLNPIKSAITSVAENLRKGEKKPLIIIESTIYPGTTEEELIPLLEEKSGLKFNEDFSIVYCPERIDPGNLKWNLANIPRVIGATNKEDGERSQEFYSSFIEAEITLLNSIKSAEATKILENSFRDVNIAFINEMAKSFEKFGINILEVIKGASTKPFGYMPFYPGPGVGGHCIPVDPYYLIERSKKNEFDHQFLILARKINESMPNYVVEMLQNELNKQGIALNGAKVGLYGIAYKKNMEDVRNSPSLKIHELLENRGVNLNVYDPYVNGEENNLQNFLKKIDYLIIGTDHDEIVNLPREEFLNIKLIIDSRNCLKKEVVEGINYCGLGNALGTFGAQPEKKNEIKEISWRELTKKTFIIAEIGKNFIQTEEEKSVAEYLDNAKFLVKKAKESGADAVKFQTHNVEDEQLNINITSPHFKSSDRYSWVSRNTRSTPLKTFWKPLKKYCDDIGIMFFSTPMSRGAAKILDQVNVPIWKVGSGDILDFVTLDYMASTKKPIFFSSGMSTLEETEKVLNYLKRKGADVALLHCISKYPCPPEDLQLSTIEFYKERFNVTIGFSDHSIGYDSAVAAVALGAKIVEKHFSLSRDLWGADHKVSMIPEEFSSMVKGIREIESNPKKRGKYLDKDIVKRGMGVKGKTLQDGEATFRQYFRKSLMAGCDIPAGTVINKEMVYAMRPQAFAGGVPSEEYENVLGKVTKVELKKFDPIKFEVFG